jgi:hypothetical protein
MRFMTLNAKEFFKLVLVLTLGGIFAIIRRIFALLNIRR